MKKNTRREFLMSSTLGVASITGMTNTLMASNILSSTVGAIPSSRGTFHLTREIPIEDGYDLVVAGGGPAGAAAAICAARRGGKVLLAEATGCLGGMGTSGLVTAFDPMANGERWLVGGIMREIVIKMHRRDFLAPQVTEDFYSKYYHCWTPFRVEGYKLILDELAQQAKVEVRFFTRVVDADFDAASHTVRGVILHNIEGFRYIRAKTFIDATGDAVLADLCGVPCRAAGRDTPKIMPSTLTSIASGVDWTRAKKVSQQKALEKALAERHFTQRDYHMTGMSQVGQSLGYLNCGHMFNMNALNCSNLSDGMMLGRRLAQEYISFYKKYVPGCENIELAITASLAGVRESRRILGEYELTFDDYIHRRQFPDQIGMFNVAVDIHPYDNSLAEYRHMVKQYTQTGRLKQGECFGIPYGILVPRGCKNLWVAGRCNSSDVQVHGSIRVQPAAAMMGQAAGTAAVQAIATGQPAYDLDTAKLVETLREAGAYLPQEELSSVMTRRS